MASLNGNFHELGFAIIALFLVAWAVSFAVYKLRGLDDIEVAADRPV